MCVLASLVAAPVAADAQAAAKLHRIGLLESASSNPASDTFGQWAAFREGLQTLGYVEGRTLAIESRWADDKYERGEPGDVAAGAQDFERAFKLTSVERPDALLIFEDALIVGHTKQIADFATRERLVTMLGNPAVLEGGGLIGYGPNVREMARRGAYYVDKILKGARPAGLPIEQPTKLELVINVKTARTLGLTIPSSMLLRADRVVE
jgi:hypothetical protein